MKSLLVLVLSAVVFSSAALAADLNQHYKMMPTIQQKALMQSLDLPKVGAKSSVLYYGGPVISNVKVTAVMWGSNVDSTTQKQIGDFFATTVNSTYIDWMSEYNTNIKAVDGREGTDQSIGRGTFSGVVTITPSNTSTKLQDTDIQTEIDAQINAGHLAKPDANTLYMVYFPSGVSITLDGSKSCEAFCAYHMNYQSKTNGQVFYGVMPDLGGACSFGCGFLSSRFNSLTAVSSHELMESISDPIPTPGSSPAYPQAWNTTDGQEIGDLCTSTDTTVTAGNTSYKLQQIFDNKIQGCAPGPYSQ
jgi:opacity protein-like surface antigen